MSIKLSHLSLPTKHLHSCNNVKNIDDKMLSNNARYKIVHSVDYNYDKKKPLYVEEKTRRKCTSI